ncbi:MAG TPA: choice-of-anchor D domain-containing protein [Solirubrobacterales bacterium]|nr:choice-of-anchor D domain-containing protein [Solirubrobacterales bacterium]
MSRGHLAAVLVTLTCLLAIPASASAVEATADGNSVQLSDTPLEAAYTFDPGQVAFGDVPVGSTASQLITLTNTGGSPALIRGVFAGKVGTDWLSFGISQDTCSPVPPGITRELPAGQSCSYLLEFTPSQRGGYAEITGVVTEGEVHFIPVGGNGTEPAGEFDTGSFDFGSSPVGPSSNRPKHTFNLSSTGLDPVTVQSLSIGGPDQDAFELADPAVCSAPIPVNEKCQITVTFDPESGSPGPRAATLTALTTGGVVEVALTGNATAPLTYRAKMQIKFPKKAVVGRSARFKVTLTNTGTGPIAGAALEYKARQGKSGKAVVSKSVKVPALQSGRKTATVTVKLPKNRLSRGKGKGLLVNFELVHQGLTLAARRGTTRLDFGQAKSRRPRDVSDT